MTAPARLPCNRCEGMAKPINPFQSIRTDGGHALWDKYRCATCGHDWWTVRVPSYVLREAQ